MDAESDVSLHPMLSLRGALFLDRAVVASHIAKAPANLDPLILSEKGASTGQTLNVPILHICKCETTTAKFITKLTLLLFCLIVSRLVEISRTTLNQLIDDCGCLAYTGRTGAGYNDSRSRTIRVRSTPVIKFLYFGVDFYRMS
jgi:hypothetical protein